VTRRELDRRRYETTRRIVRHAKNRPCHDCDIQFPSYVMEFDHTKGEKKFDLATHGRRHPNAVIAEIKKCDVVCANCHKVRTYIRRLHGISTTTH
jgi:hypothetical protein